jgi:hypothetical protein
MPDAYITKAELVGSMPLEDIEKALDDGGSSDPEVVWAAVCQEVADEIHGLLAPAYSYPFPSPVQPTIKTAARTLTLFRLYGRRGLNGDANPMKEAADSTSAHLRGIGAQRIRLDLAGPAPAVPGAAAPVAVTGSGRVASATAGRMPV